MVQDLSLNPQVTRYRRERWETPDGKTIIAALDPGFVGGYGPNLHRLMMWTACPQRHHSAKAWSPERHKEGDRP